MKNPPLMEVWIFHLVRALVRAHLPPKGAHLQIPSAREHTVTAVDDAEAGAVRVAAIHLAAADVDHPVVVLVLGALGAVQVVALVVAVFKALEVVGETLRVEELLPVLLQELLAIFATHRFLGRRRHLSPRFYHTVFTPRGFGTVVPAFSGIYIIAYLIYFVNNLHLFKKQPAPVDFLYLIK